MFETDNPKQPFFIANHIDLYPADIRILVKLYQPLIGSLALSMYLSLNEDYNSGAMLSDSTGLYTLQEQLDCNLKSLFIALHKLEGTGLIQTRMIENEIMGQVLVFQLAKVPSSNEFFATPLLASLLKEKIGVSAFQKLSHVFAQEGSQNLNQPNGLATATDVSASFMDVFRLPDQEAIEPSIEVKQAAQENQIAKPVQASIKQDDKIDWDFMKQQFEIYQIPETEIDRNREAIRAVMRTYGLSEQEFVDEALSCLHGDYQLDMSLIKKTIANSIHAQTTREQLRRVTRTEETSPSNAHFSEQEQKLLQLAKSKSPAQFLYYLKTERHDYVDASEYHVLDSLYNEKGIPAELLNLLTYACLKSGPNISYRLANKILHDWLQHGVKTGEQALDYMNKREQNKGKYPRYTQAKRVEKATDWSKKKATVKSDVSSADLKNFFKNFEDQNGMK
ncbi:DnaD domain protein [Lactobacillus apis]|uniref:DnaD domain protein n=1 Tax=Lactobacillus apis TaxID=303541 RepID=UPI00242F058C|nr:DnaD domain protein [Lactobacillus apis]